jgi:uncharacterized phage infection (PIP) family protein YhgE
MAQYAKLNSGEITMQISELEVQLDSMEGNLENARHTTSVIKDTTKELVKGQKHMPTMLTTLMAFMKS